MTRIFWDTFFLISGSLFTLGAGPSNSTAVRATKASSGDPAAAANAAAANVPPVQRILLPTGAEKSHALAAEASVPREPAFTAAPSAPTSSSAGTVASAAASVESFLSTSGADLGNTTAAGANGSADAISAAAGAISASPAKKFVAAAVWSHFAECPDSHRHFCLHGSCRFLTLEETPACVCHQGFVGMRCEHADLLAVVATNHRQTVTTVLVLCVIACVLVMVLCTLLHCWWRQECRRQRRAHHYCPQKPGVSLHPSESVV